MQFVIYNLSVVSTRDRCQQVNASGKHVRAHAHGLGSTAKLATLTSAKAKAEEHFVAGSDVVSSGGGGPVAARASTDYHSAAIYACQLSQWLKCKHTHTATVKAKISLRCHLYDCCKEKYNIGDKTRVRKTIRVNYAAVENDKSGNQRSKICLET